MGATAHPDTPRSRAADLHAHPRRRRRLPASARSSPPSGAAAGRRRAADAAVGLGRLPPGRRRYRQQDPLLPRRGRCSARPPRRRCVRRRDYVAPYTAATRKLVRGTPVAELLEEIERDEDTLVSIGSSGTGRLLGIVEGAVATELIHRSPSSVLVVRQAKDGFPAPNRRRRRRLGRVGRRLRRGPLPGRALRRRAAPARRLGRQGRQRAARRSDHRRRARRPPRGSRRRR